MLQLMHMETSPRTRSPSALPVSPRSSTLSEQVADIYTHLRGVDEDLDQFLYSRWRLEDSVSLQYVCCWRWISEGVPVKRKGVLRAQVCILRPVATACT